MVNEVINAIGNVVEANEVAGVLYTLSADAVIRTNDIDSGFLVARIAFPTLDAAKVVYAAEVAKAAAIG